MKIDTNCFSHTKESEQIGKGFYMLSQVSKLRGVSIEMEASLRCYIRSMCLIRFERAPDTWTVLWQNARSIGYGPGLVEFCNQCLVQPEADSPYNDGFLGKKLLWHSMKHFLVEVLAGCSEGCSHHVAIRRNKWLIDSSFDVDKYSASEDKQAVTSTKVLSICMDIAGT